MVHATPETCARRLLDLAVERLKTRADGIVLGRTLWQSFAAVGNGLQFALGLDHCLRQGWLIDYGARLLLTKAGHAAALSKGVEMTRDAPSVDRTGHSGALPEEGQGSALLRATANAET
jgi:hypothetical protein